MKDKENSRRISGKQGEQIECKDNDENARRKWRIEGE